jgi:hypothetical protein
MQATTLAVGGLDAPSDRNLAWECSWRSLDLDDLSEVDVPCVFVGKLDVRDLKIPAVPEVRRDVESPDVNHAHGAKH